LVNSRCNSGSGPSGFCGVSNSGIVSRAIQPIHGEEAVN
jgi:hypothetical protein